MLPDTPERRTFIQRALLFMAVFVPHVSPILRPADRYCAVVLANGLSSTILGMVTCPVTRCGRASFCVAKFVHAIWCPYGMGRTLTEGAAMIASLMLMPEFSRRVAALYKARFFGRLEKPVSPHCQCVTASLVPLDIWLALRAALPQNLMEALLREEPVDVSLGWVELLTGWSAAALMLALDYAQKLRLQSTADGIEITFVLPIHHLESKRSQRPNSFLEFWLAECSRTAITSPQSSSRPSMRCALQIPLRPRKPSSVALNSAHQLPPSVNAAESTMWGRRPSGARHFTNLTQSRCW